MATAHQNESQLDKGRRHSWVWFFVGLFLGLLAILPAAGYCAILGRDRWRRIVGSIGYGTLARIGIEVFVALALLGPPARPGHILGLILAGAVPTLGQMTGFYGRY